MGVSLVAAHSSCGRRDGVDRPAPGGSRPKEPKGALRAHRSGTSGGDTYCFQSQEGAGNGHSFGISTSLRSDASSWIENKDDKISPTYF